MNESHYFFALPLSQPLQQQLIQWRANSLPQDNGFPVAGEQMQCILAWLGQVSPQQLKQLEDAAANIRQSAFQLTINDAGFWPKNGQFWVGCRPAPRGLLQLGALLRSQAARYGCPQPAKPFFPYITLQKQINQPFKLPAADFSWTQIVEHFELRRARYQRGAMRYHTVAHFPLTATATSRS